MTISQLHKKLGKLIEAGHGKRKVVVNFNGWGTQFDDSARARLMTMYDVGDGYEPEPDDGQPPEKVFAIDSIWE